MTENKNEENSEIQCRTLLINFYSSQINTHGRLIIGVSVLLFTVLDVTVRLKYSQISQFSIYQSALSGVGIFVLSSVFWFLLMRDIAYGVLADCVINAPILNVNTSLLVRVNSGVTSYALKHCKVLSLFPVDLFVSLGTRPKGFPRPKRVIGILLCILFGTVTSLISMTFIGLI